MRKFIFAAGAALAVFGVVIGLVTAGPFRTRGGFSTCGPEGCGIAAAPVAQSDTWEWKKLDIPGSDNRVHLFRNSGYHGFWDYRYSFYRAYLGNDKWGDHLAAAPHPVPIWAQAKTQEQPGKLPPLEPWQLDGVQADKIDGKSEPLYTLNGVEITHEQADDKLLSDDSKKLWLIVNGNNRDKVIADLKADPSYATFLSHVRVWSVPADHFSLLDRDSKKPLWSNTGNPSICLMGPDRTILYEKDGYTGPADLEALRKADPANPAPPPAPKKDDPSKPNGPANPPASFPLMPLLPVAALAVGAGAVILARRKSQ